MQSTGCVQGTYHYGKHVICRVQKSLPSAKFRALGKDLLCRAPHSAKYNTRQRGWHSAKTCTQQRQADTRQRWVGLNGIQRRPLCRVPPVWHSAKNLFCRVPKLGTRQNNFFWFFATNFFEALVHYHKQHV